MQRVLLKDLRAFAKEIAGRLVPKSSGATLVALHGDLGAGKTTFVQALARELGVEETVQSPTYVLMKSYDTHDPRFKKLVHLDLYRLEQPQELAALRPEEFLRQPNTLVAVEWPERVGGALQKPDLAINFSSEDAGEGERYIEVV
jgi:tRNA threonylcarbamoyladenosine biosynthesis protein TsaE